MTRLFPVAWWVPVLLIAGTLPAAAQAPAPTTAPATAPATAKPAPAAMIDRIVATMGDDAITLLEVRKRAASARNPMAEAVAGRGAETDATMKAALDDLIAERLILAEARKLDITATDAEVDQHTKAIKDQNGWSDDEFATAVKMLGFEDVKSYREHARKELLKSQVLRLKVGARIRITDREVEEEFNKEFDGGKTEQEVHLWHIVLRLPDTVTLPLIQEKLAKAEELRARAAAGQFEAVARESSEDGSAPKGGDVGWFARGRLQPTLEEAAFGLKDNEVSPVVQSSLGFHILRVTEHRRVPLKDPDEARARVRYELSETAFAKILKEYIQELRSAAHVEIKPL